MSLVDEEALAGRHVPLPDTRVGRTGDHEGVVDGHSVDVARVAPAKVKMLGTSGTPGTMIKPHLN